MATHRLGIVIASTRPGRVGDKIARWFSERAIEHGEFEIEVLDLAAISLPFFDEPEHPSKKAYVHQHTRDWSEQVAKCDAFVVVMPEYNYAFNAPLKNAIDFLYGEWHYKPVGFVSYGGISGGTRAVQMIKQVVTTLRMTPIGDTIALPQVSSMFDEDGTFRPSDHVVGAASGILDELHRMTHAMALMRDDVAVPC